MKLFKRLLALSLAILSLFALASCDKAGSESKDDEKEISIVADWKGDLAYVSFAAAALGDSDPALAESLSKLDLDKYTVKATISFKDDGTYTMVLDSESMTTSINAFAEALLTETYNSLFPDGEADMTLEQYIAASKNTLTQLFPDASALTANGKYKLDGEKLFVTAVPTDEFDENVYLNIKLSADKIEFKEAVGESALIPKEILPVTFTKA